ncbi:MAG TPA: c-type cytochrome [Thermoanaerobaculia bacterium]|nr:c-type cytochrome [Thermoanaerobaculia bacterium]
MKKLAVLLILFAACAKQSEKPATSTAPPAASVGDSARGKELMNTFACSGCHVIPGIEMGGTLGPSLEGWANKPAINRKFPNTADNMIQWLQNPQSMDPQTTMPGVGANPIDARDMTAFLFTLK